MILGDLAIVVDCEHKTAPPASLGEEFGYSIGTPDLRGGRMQLATAKRVSREVFDLWTRRAVPSRGDLILAREAPVGQVAYVDGGHPVCLGQRTVLIQIDTTRAEPRFLHFRLLAPDIQAWMQDRSSGSTVAHLNVADVRQIPLPQLPRLDEQRRIAGVLGAFDDLIDTDLRLQQQLHEIGRAAYLAAVVAESATVRLAEVAEFHNRARVPLSKDQRMSMPGSYPYYGATGKMDSVGKYLFDGVHVLVGEDGSVVNADGSPVVQMVWGKYWVNNHAHVLSGSGISDGLLRQALETSNVTPHVTGAVQPKLSMGRLKELQISIPTDQTVSERLDELAWAERELIDETASLTAVRDALLPLLMSGRITVDEVWEAVS